MKKTALLRGFGTFFILFGLAWMGIGVWGTFYWASLEPTSDMLLAGLAGVGLWYMLPGLGMLFMGGLLLYRSAGER